MNTHNFEGGWGGGWLVKEIKCPYNVNVSPWSTISLQIKNLMLISIQHKEGEISKITMKLKIISSLWIRPKWEGGRGVT